MSGIARYDSIAALTAAARKGERLSGIYGARGMHPSDDRRDWCGNETIADTLRHGTQGNEQLVPEAERLVAQFAAEIDVPTLSWESDICGAYPIVPEYLAGMPECMRRRMVVENERAPLNIWVLTEASFSVTGAQMLSRGTAILAFVLAMSRIRPITLHILSVGDDGGKGDSVITAPINTAPLDLATAAWALTSVALFRRLMLGMSADLHGCKGCFPQDYHNAGIAYLKQVVGRLGGNPETDVIIDAAKASDQLINDPCAWLREQIARYVGEAV